MSSSIELYKAYFDASWANPPASVVEANETYLSDDFQVFDKDGNVEMDRQTYLGSAQLLFAAFEDYKYLYNDIRAEGDDVIVSGHFEGTHTRDLDLTMMGLGVIPASGEKIVWPEATIKLKIEGDKIASLVNLDDAGGMVAFLEALGVKLPSA
jgi:predicted ester cyclase